MTSISNATKLTNPEQVSAALHTLEQKYLNHRDTKVSDRYQYIDSNDVMDIVIDQLPEGAEIALHVPGGGFKTTKHMFEVILPNKIELFGTECKPRVLLWNSYLGECSFQIDTGIYRFICANGMRIGEQTWGIKARHANGPTLRHKFAELDEQFGAALDYLSSGKFEQDIKQTTEHHVGRYKALEIVKNLSGISDKVKHQATFKIVHPELLRTEDKGWRVWDIYNIVNEENRLGSRSELSAAANDRGLLDQIRAAA